MRWLTPRPRRDEKGAVIVMMTAFVLGMVGMAALVVDVGAILDEKRQLQNGADAAALGLAQYIGRNCPVAASAACTSALQSEADQLATGNARDGFTKVAAPTTNHVTKRVTVQTSTLGRGSDPILPYAFGQALSGVKGQTVNATATASWAGLQTASVVRLTLSRCEFSMNTDNGRVFGTPTVILFHRVTTRQCNLGVSGASLAGGFGWLDDRVDGNPNDCIITPSADSTLVSDTGNSNPANCRMENYLNKDVLLAVFDGVSGSGGNGSYHVYGFTQFHMTGFTFPSGGSGGVSCGTNACLSGHFVKFVPIGDLGGPNVGNLVALVS
jgi:hypothetical protein